VALGRLTGAVSGPRPRTRVLIFVAALAALTALVQWHSFSNLLDDTLGLRWSADIVDFLRRNTQGLVLLALVTLFYEFVGFESSGEETRRRDFALNELLSTALASAPNNALIQYGLEREHGDPSAGALSRYLLSDGALLREFVVSIRVQPDGSQFLVTIGLQYKATVERYVVAITSDPLVVELMSVAREVTETFVVPPGQVQLAPNAAGSAVTISAVTVNDAHDAGTRAALTFKPLPERQRRRLLRDAGITRDDSAAKLYVAEPMKDLRLPGRATELRYAVSFTASRSRGHTFWASDRPLHVRSIEVDLSALSASQVAGAEVHLFVGTVGWAPGVDGAAGRWLFPLDRWVVAGQGVFVVWPQA